MSYGRSHGRGGSRRRCQSHHRRATNMVSALLLPSVRCRAGPRDAYQARLVLWALSCAGRQETRASPDMNHMMGPTESAAQCWCLAQLCACVRAATAERAGGCGARGFLELGAELSGTTCVPVATSRLALFTPKQEGCPEETGNTKKSSFPHTPDAAARTPVRLKVCAGARGGGHYPPENSRTGVDCSLSRVAPPPTTVQSLTPTTRASHQ